MVCEMSVVSGQINLSL